MDLNKAAKTLGKNARDMREKKGWTQDLMRDFGFNYRYYQKIEAGQVNATLELLARLATVFKCKLSDLLKE